MRAPLLIINGPPAAGKTTLALKLSRHLRLPLLTKDRIKESLGDTLEVETYEQSRALDNTTFALMLSLAQLQIDIGMGIVLEAPYYGQTAENLASLTTQSRGAVIQCEADRATLFNRWRARVPDRHWVHFDHPDQGLHPANYLDWNSADFAASQPPPLALPVLHVNTINDYEPPFVSIVQWLRHNLGLDTGSPSPSASP